MTFKGFVGYGLLAGVVLGISKVLGSLLLTDVWLIRICLLSVQCVLATGLVRRLGTINYLEAIMVVIVWGLLMFFIDVFILAWLLQFTLFSTSIYWLGMVVIMISWFLFHRKRHVELRKKS